MNRRPSVVIVAGLLAGVASLAVLGGCGQKGALTMPPPTAAMTTPAALATPAAAPAAPATPALPASSPPLSK